MAGILSTLARYTETCLKVLQDIVAHRSDPGYVVNTHLDELSTCLVAQLRFLQEEQNTLFMQGSFGKKTHALFRQFKRNTSTLGSADIKVLHAAVTLAAIPPEPSGPPRGWGRGFSSHGPFRGGYQGVPGSGRGHFNNSSRIQPDWIDEQSQ